MSDDIEVQPLTRFEALALLITQCCTRMDVLEIEMQEIRNQLTTATQMINDIIHEDI